MSKLKSIFIFFVICIFCFLLLSVLSKKLEQKTQKNIENKIFNEKKSVLKNADYFEVFSKDKIYVGFDKAKNKIGFVFYETEKGEKGNIDFVIGISSNNFITNVNILNKNFGYEIYDKKFLDSFVGFKKIDFETKQILTEETKDKLAIVRVLYSVLNKVNEINKGSIFNDGEFAGLAKGSNGMIEARVLIEDGVITKITATGDYEIPNVWKKVMEKIPNEVLAKQSTDGVEVMEIAKRTSRGLINAVKEALETSKRKNSNEAY